MQEDKVQDKTPVVGKVIAKTAEQPKSSAGSSQVKIVKVTEHKDRHTPEVKRESSVEVVQRIEAAEETKHEDHQE